MDHIFVHLVEGFEEIEALATIDILRRAGLEVTSVSLTNNLTVTGAHSIPVIADSLFETIDYTKATVLLLPGGPGTPNLAKHSGLIEHIKEFNSANKWIAAICAAPGVLGQLGLLTGKKAVCFPGYESQLEGAEILHIPAITDNNIITGRGAGATFQFALEIVAQLCGKNVALELAQKMVIN